MGLIAPPNYIAPPAIAGHRFGLFSVAMMTDDNVRWNLGVEWEPLAGGAAELRPSDCVDEYNVQPITEFEAPSTREGVPFVVVGTYSCKSASRSIDEAEERARLHLSGGEERAVERVLMNGAGLVGAEPTFADAEVVGSPTGVSLTRAVSLLERGLAIEGNSEGAIHLPRSLTPFALRDSLIDRYGQHLETINGSWVVSGSGYDVENVSPDGTPAPEGKLWVYATGRPTVRRGEVFLQPDESNFIKRDTNDIAILAQREYLVTWNGPTLAALVDIDTFEDCPCVEAE